MLVRDARAAARAWVAEQAAGDARFRGAFLTGSTTALPADGVLPAFSDVDVVVVVSGSSAPPRLGKLAHRGVLLDVSYLPETELATAAETFYLAPSFAGDHLIADPTGRLGLLRDEISPRFGDPAAVRGRCGSVIRRIDRGLSAFDPAAEWHDQVPAWMFPASLTTHVVLVAALRPPTVRLRYLATRTVLRARDQDALYQTLLGLLGCASCDHPTVQHHLDRLAVVFDLAAAVARTPFFFSTDITAAARPIAVDASQALLDSGDHREAVFWIVATYARCQKILAADAPARVRDDAGSGFRAAVTDLLGVSDTAGLLARRDAVRELLPGLAQDVAVRVRGSSAKAPAYKTAARTSRPE